MYFVHKELWHGLFRAAISASLLLGLGIVIYQKSTSPHSIDLPHFSILEIAALTLFLLSTSLLNWAIESLKWRIVTKDLHAQAFFSSIKEVLVGISFSMITPNRTGEFFGRVANWPAKLAIKGSLRNTYNSVAQSLVTVSFGIIAFVFTPFSFQNLITNSLAYAAENAVFIIGVAVVAAIGAIWYARQSKGKLRHILSSLPSDISHRHKLQIFLLSVLRYFVFTTQFVVILYWLDISIPFEDMLKAIALGYFFLFVIPSVALAELGIREISFVGVFGLYQVEALPIASASLIIWVINLLIPALLGYVFYLKGAKNKSL